MYVIFLTKLKPPICQQRYTDCILSGPKKKTVSPTILTDLIFRPPQDNVYVAPAGGVLDGHQFIRQKGC